MGSVVPLKKSANSAYLELKNLLGKKLDKVEILIEAKLKSNVNLIEKMSGHHLKSGGKRLRALLTLGSLIAFIGILIEKSYLSAEFSFVLFIVFALIFYIVSGRLFNDNQKSV